MSRSDKGTIYDTGPSVYAVGPTPAVTYSASFTDEECARFTLTRARIVELIIESIEAEQARLRRLLPVPFVSIT